VQESDYSQNLQSASGFNFEFNDKAQGKAKVIARKRPTKTTAETSSSANSNFKLISEEKSVKAPKVDKKKKTQDDSVTLDQVLEKNEKEGRKEEFIKPLGVVDFTEEPSRKKKKKKSDKPAVDYAKVPDKKKQDQLPLEKKKRQKVKFSKVSNPFPNQPSKNPEAQAKNPEVQEKAPKVESPEKKKHKKAKAAVAAAEVQSENSSVFTEKSVDSLNIHPFSIKNMKEVLNFHKLTHVQSKAIPLALEGKDVLIRSCTGTGKTLTYALPIVERLHKITPKISRSQGIHALVIVPTRELCVQVYELFLKLVKPFTWIVPGYLSGGEKRKTEKARLRNGITILVSTPGRLCDHLMHTESMKLDNVQCFVLDEADRLLELGYENDVKKVTDTIIEHSKKANKDIQKVLLSATLTAKVKQLAGLTLENPAYVDNENVDTIMDSMNQIETDENITIPSGVLQKYFMVPPQSRFVVLCSLLVQQMAHGARKILIFFPTQHVVDYHYDILVEFLTQSFTKKERTMKSYLNNDNDDDDDIDEMQEESDEEETDVGNIWLPNVTLFK
jgi:ATP-dependent RNA helicase DDX31/DBP7